VVRTFVDGWPEQGEGFPTPMPEITSERFDHREAGQGPIPYGASRRIATRVARGRNRCTPPPARPTEQPSITTATVRRTFASMGIHSDLS